MWNLYLCHLSHSWCKVINCILLLFSWSVSLDLFILLPFLEDLVFGFFFYCIFIFSHIYFHNNYYFLFPAYFGFNLLFFFLNLVSPPHPFYWDKLTYTHVFVLLNVVLRSLVWNLSLFLIYAFRIKNFPNVALAKSHTFWWTVFQFSFNLK